MNDLKTIWMTSWAQLKRWRGAAGLPVLPPLGAVIELAALVALIILVDWTFPWIGVTALEPSPLWLPVLLLSLQYGTVAGLLAAAAATAVYVFNGVAEQVVGENFFAYLLRIWALPILWIGVALVLGQFRLRQIAEKQVIRQKLAQRTEEAQRLAAYAKDLEERCHRLERQMTTRSTEPVKPVLDTLSAFAGPTVDLATALDMVTSRLWPGMQASVFVISSRGCEIAARSGWPETAVWATEIAPTHPLYRAIFNDRRSVSILNPGDEAVLAAQGVAAHPIFTADGNRAVGMFKIEMVDPAMLDRDSGGHARLIARLLAVILTEPRVLAKDVDGAPAGSRLARFKRGWKRQPTSEDSGDAADQQPAAPGQGAKRSPRPRQSN